MLQSPPSRRRGLKFIKPVEVRGQFPVASFSEAWIEIGMRKDRYSAIASPPSRRRGLKSRRSPICDQS